MIAARRMPTHPSKDIAVSGCATNCANNEPLHPSGEGFEKKVFRLFEGRREWREGHARYESLCPGNYMSDAILSLHILFLNQFFSLFPTFKSALTPLIKRFSRDRRKLFSIFEINSFYEATVTLLTFIRREKGWHKSSKYCERRELEKRIGKHRSKCWIVTIYGEIETFELVPFYLIPAKQITPDDVRKSSYNLPLLTTRHDRYS